MVSLIAISVYSYTKQIVCFALCYALQSTMPTLQREIETTETKIKNGEQSWENRSMDFYFSQNGKFWPKYILFTLTRVRFQMHSEHKNYDNKFLVCSNLMCTLLLVLFFHDFFFGTIANTKWNGKNNNRKTFPICNEFSSTFFFNL